MVPPGVFARFGALPDRETAELLTALVWLENARGNAIIQYNWGNISCNASAAIDFWRPPWFDLEAVNALPDTDKNKARYLDLNARMKAHTVPNAFRAFGSHEQGIHFWLASVKPSMYAAAATGDPFAFASAYFTSGYCPDQSCKDSGPTFAKLQAEIRAKGYFNNLASSSKKKPEAPAPSSPSAPSPSSAGSSGALSSSGVSDSKFALAHLTEIYLTNFASRGYDQTSMVDFVVAQTFGLDLAGMAAWYVERGRVLTAELEALS